MYAPDEAERRRARRHVPQGHRRLEAYQRGLSNTVVTHTVSISVIHCACEARTHLEETPDAERGYEQIQHLLRAVTRIKCRHGQYKPTDAHRATRTRTDASMNRTPAAG